MGAHLSTCARTDTTLTHDMQGKPIPPFAEADVDWVKIQGHEHAKAHKCIRSTRDAKFKMPVEAEGEG